MAVSFKIAESEIVLLLSNEANSICATQTSFNIFDKNVLCSGLTGLIPGSESCNNDIGERIGAIWGAGNWGSVAPIPSIPGN